MQDNPFPTVFELDSPLGGCVAVRLPTDGSHELGLPQLPSQERALAVELARTRQASWIGGRIALRHAIRRFQQFEEPILSTDRGAPNLPTGMAGSISHKRTLAVAIAAPSSGFTLGIDLEGTAHRPVDIGPRVLVAEELRALEVLPEPRRWLALMTRFSLKEAVYKALDPFVRRYIAFSEAAVDPGDGGEAVVTLRLRGNEGPFKLDAWWTIREEHIVSVVRATPACR